MYGRLHPALRGQVYQRTAAAWTEDIPVPAHEEEEDQHSRMDDVASSISLPAHHTGAAAELHSAAPTVYGLVACEKLLLHSSAELSDPVGYAVKDDILATFNVNNESGRDVIHIVCVDAKTGVTVTRYAPATGPGGDPTVSNFTMVPPYKVNVRT